VAPETQDWHEAYAENLDRMISPVWTAPASE